MLEPLGYGEESRQKVVSLKPGLAKLKTLSVNPAVNEYLFRIGET